MRITDVKRLENSLPCELCHRFAKFELEITESADKLYIYLCKKHLLKEKYINESISSVTNRMVENNETMLKAYYHNVHFKAFYEKEISVLHILDCMGSHAYRSIRSAINDILPYIIRALNIDQSIKVYLYNTDLTVCEYKGNADIKFTLLRKYNSFIYQPFIKEQRKLYS